MTSLITPGHHYEGIPASEAKKILMDFASFDRQSFNFKLADTPYARMNVETDNGAVDSYDFYRDFFLRHDILAPKAQGFSLTDEGLTLVKSEFRDPVSRERASKEIDALIQRAKWIMDDPDHMVYVRAIVIFGSYVDTEKSMLGDLDVGVCYGPKPECRNLTSEQWEARAKAMRARLAPEEASGEVKAGIEWAEDHMLSCLKNGEEFISLHRTREVETLHVTNVCWVYDAKKALLNHATVERSKLGMINKYLENTL